MHGGGTPNNIDLVDEENLSEIRIDNQELAPYSLPAIALCSSRLSESSSSESPGIPIRVTGSAASSTEGSTGYSPVNRPEIAAELAGIVNCGWTENENIPQGWFTNRSNANIIQLKMKVGSGYGNIVMAGGCLAKVQVD